MSATLPARLGEPSRALIVARRLGRPREALPGRARHARLADAAQRRRARDPRRGDVLDRRPVRRAPAGARSGTRWRRSPCSRSCWSRRRCCAPGCRRGRHACARWMRQGRAALTRVRRGLSVFRRPRLGARGGRRCSSARGRCSGCAATCCSSRSASTTGAGLGAAAAVLFAVNVTAVLPVTPSNLGVFQAACVAVLTGAYGVGAADALGYGIILQAVEIATAVVHGRAGAGQGGPVLARRAAAGDARRAGAALRAAARGRDGAGARVAGRPPAPRRSRRLNGGIEEGPGLARLPVNAARARFRHGDAALTSICNVNAARGRRKRGRAAFTRSTPAARAIGRRARR